MAQKKRTWLLRVLSWILVPGRGEVRALEEAMHLEGVLRFVGVVTATIVLPSMVLAYFGLNAISVQENAEKEELAQTANNIVGTFWNEVDQDFSRFESEVRDRLEAGRSPLERAREMHPHLLVALQLDPEGKPAAPFHSPTDGGYPLEFLIHPQLQAARRLLMVEPLAAAEMYEDISRRSMSISAAGLSVSGQARFDQAQALLAAGERDQAIVLLEEISNEYVKARGVEGFRLGDQARLLRGQLLLETDQVAGVQVLQELVDDLLEARWTIGQGGEAAIVREAHALLEPILGRDWAARVRG
ncbi:MAG: hypothetical protein AAFV53_00720, partial [Myxococcota bacterium]